MRILPWYSSPPPREIKEKVGNSANPIQLPTSSSLSILGFVVAVNRTAATCEALREAASSSNFCTMMDTVPGKISAQVPNGMMTTEA